MEKLLKNVPESAWKNPDGSIKNMSVAITKIMPFVGLRKITNENKVEFYMRACLIEAILGTALSTPEGVPYPIEFDDVEKHVGAEDLQVIDASTMDFWREYASKINPPLIEVPQLIIPK